MSEGNSSELDKEFQSVATDVMKEINEQLAIAGKALAKAMQLSDANGIPFSAGVSLLAQDYVPSTFSDKWSDVSNILVQSLTGVYDTSNDYGWEHSAVC